LLDFTARTGGSPGATQSVKQALDVAGIPYIVTTNVTTASTYAMIVISSRVKNATLRNGEITAIRNYVVNGGILVASRVASTKAGLLTLFGISGSTAASNRHTMIWNTDVNDPSLRWFNDPNEKTISLGRSNIPVVIPTLSYASNGASISPHITIVILMPEITTP